MSRIVIGVDIAKLKFDVASLNDGTPNTKRLPTTDKGTLCVPQRLINYAVRAAYPTLV
mgnify:CR=1 FL=1